MTDDFSDNRERKLHLRSERKERERREKIRVFAERNFLLRRWWKEEEEEESSVQLRDRKSVV